MITSVAINAALKGLLTACTDSGSVTEALRAAQDALVKAAGKDW